MLLIPIGHEEQKVQRTPWVTFVLIGLNVLIFLYTFFTNPAQKELTAPLVAVLEYYAEHPYLELSQEIRELFNEEQRKKLDSMADEADPSQFSEEEIAEQQAELDRKTEVCVDVLHSSSDFHYGHRANNPVWWSYFTSMFLHGDFLHLLGNMLFLYLAGCSLEDVWGRPLYVSFYLAGGIIATLAHDLKFMDSGVPLIGA